MTTTPMAAPPVTTGPVSLRCFGVDQVDDGLEHGGVGVRLHAVTEVEDVPGMTTVVGEHGTCTGEGHLATGEHQGRVEVALHDEIGVETSAGLGDRGAPVEAEHARTGVEHRAEQ